jgi:hypothetical protein
MKDDQVIIAQEMSLAAQNIGHVAEIRVGSPSRSAAGKAREDHREESNT